MTPRVPVRGPQLDRRECGELGHRSGRQFRARGGRGPVRRGPVAQHRLQPHDCVDCAGLRHRDAEQSGDLDHGARHALDLQWLAGLEVLQHRRAVVADLDPGLSRRSIETGSVIPSAAPTAAHSSMTRARAPCVSGARRSRRASPGQRGRRVERDVADQLQPELPAHPASTGHLRPPAAKASAIARQRSLVRAVGLADREARALDVLDDARLDELRGGVRDAADHPPRVDRRARRRRRGRRSARPCPRARPRTTGRTTRERRSARATRPCRPRAARRGAARARGCCRP